MSEHWASLVDNILTTDIFNNSLNKAVIRSDVSDHFSSKSGRQKNTALGTYFMYIRVKV